MIVPSADEIAAIAERYFQRSGRTQFPTVRLIARRLGCKQQHIEDATGEGLYCLDGVNVEGWKLGDLEIYVFNPESINA
jgi:hypothetical protein